MQEVIVMGETGRLVEGSEVTEMEQRTEQTSIRVSKDTKDKLNIFKVVEEESFEKVIIRLMDIVIDNYEESDLKPSAEKILKERIKSVRSGEVMSTKQLLDELRKAKTSDNV